ncbi:MAG: hypothetical protein ACR2FN_05895 [Chitinophagaceae bacterium]
MENKLGGKSFKFASSQFPYEKPPPALRPDKQSKEFVLSMMFSHILFFNGQRITKIELNKDDSDGKPDSKIVINGQEKGIQLRKISLNDPLRRINTAETKTNELVNLISDCIQVEKPINVYIYLDSINKNAIPKGNEKQKKKLAEFICQEISKNKEKLFGEKPEIIYSSIEDNNLKTLANNITLNPINAGHKSFFKGKNLIHINYEFDTHDWSEEDLNFEIGKIIKEKTEGMEDILLIWGDRFGTPSRVCFILTQEHIQKNYLHLKPALHD